MNFKKALIQVYNSREDDEKVKNPFYLYSRLSDLCSSSYEESRKVSAFHTVDSRIGLFKALMENRTDVINKYDKVKDVLSEQNFRSLINMVSGVIDGTENGQDSKALKPVARVSAGNARTSSQGQKMTPNFAPKGANNNVVRVKAPPKPTLKKNAAANNAVQKIAQPRNAQPNAQPKPTPNPPQKYTPKKSTPIAFLNNNFAKILIISAITIGSIFVISVILSLILKWPWAYWQWVIGILVGGALTVGITFAVSYFHEEGLVSFYLLGPIALGFIILTNLILGLVLRENYVIIHGCFSFYSIAAGIALLCVTYSENENGWTLIDALILLINILETILIVSVS